MHALPYLHQEILKGRSLIPQDPFQIQMNRANAGSLCKDVVGWGRQRRVLLRLSPAGQLLVRGAGAGLPWALPGLTDVEKVGCH